LPTGDADAQALHVKSADKAVHIGPTIASESYLNIDAVIAAASKSGAQAIHPGYGFLSENAAFADACQAAGISFIGPRPESMRLMGLKDAARQRMLEAGVPIVPGYHGKKSTSARPDILKSRCLAINTARSCICMNATAVCRGATKK